MKALRIGLLIIFSLGAIYIAMAGWTKVELDIVLSENKSSSTEQKPVLYDGMEFKNVDALILDKTTKGAKFWFPWVLDLPKPVSLFLTSISFGYLGGLMRIFYEIGSQNGNIDYRTLCRLGLSSFSGLLILGISYSIPSALTGSNITLRPITLLFLCLFAGLFSEHLLLWLREQFEKIFQSQKKGET